MTTQSLLHGLLVEDNTGDVGLAREWFASVPIYLFKISCVTQFGEAIEVMTSTPLGGVRLDLHLPDSNDIATLQRLRRAREDVTVVVLSARVPPGECRLLYREGVQDVLLKDAPLRRALARRLFFTYYEQHCAREPQCNAAKLLDVLLPDIVLLQMNGHQRAEVLFCTRPEPRALYLSGYSDDPIVCSSRSHTQPFLLPKLFTSTALAQKVRDVLDRLTEGHTKEYLLPGGDDE